MQNLSFQQYYDQMLAIFSEHLQKTFPKLPAEVGVLSDSMGYSLFSGGKRLRPVLLLSTVQSIANRFEFALPFACAIEYIHTYSLIHDDLPCMDDDDLRRGQPTNHIRFGEDIALLAGDALLTHAFALMSTDAVVKDVDGDKIVRIFKVLAEKAGVFGMVTGQAADIKRPETKSEESLLRFIHAHKTGALLTTSLEVGGILADLDPANQKRLVLFGEEIGTCFQIQDDILDETGETEQLGKPQGSDLKNQKLTYPKVYGLDKSKKLAHETLQRALAHLESMDHDLLRLKQFAEFILNRTH